MEQHSLKEPRIARTGDWPKIHLVLRFEPLLQHSVCLVSLSPVMSDLEAKDLGLSSNSATSKTCVTLV